MRCWESKNVSDDVKSVKERTVCEVSLACAAAKPAMICFIFNSKKSKKV